VLDKAPKVWYPIAMIRNNQITNTLKWLGTLTLILGVGINSLGYYPLGPIVLMFGGVIWVVVGYMWQENSIILTNLIITLVSIIGLCVNYGVF
jgi:hypothetical protein